MVQQIAIQATFTQLMLWEGGIKHSLEVAKQMTKEVDIIFLRNGIFTSMINVIYCGLVVFNLGLANKQTDVHLRVIQID